MCHIPSQASKHSTCEVTPLPAAPVYLSTSGSNMQEQFHMAVQVFLRSGATASWQGLILLALLLLLLLLLSELSGAV